VVPLGDPSPLPKMSDVDISKLKVVELKAELQARGLDTKGNKAVLVKRLKDAMDAGPTGEGPDLLILLLYAGSADARPAAPPSVKEEPAEAEVHSNNNNNTEEDEGACPAAAEAPPPQADAEMVQVKEEPMEVATAQVNGEQQDQAAVKTEQGAGDAPTQDNSDLNLSIGKERFSAEPFSQLGFGLMWAGARATYGVLKGKVCYETKITKYQDVSHLPSDEPTPNVARVGFSTESTSMQLGEEPLSYGYGGTGKISVDCKFKDYGEPFGEGDVILGLVDMDSDPVRMSFAKNGKDLGVAFEVAKATLGGQALFPHVLSKNCSFEVNFGQKEAPWFPLPKAYQDYSFLGCVPLDERLRGVLGPKKKADCE
ncbi:E1b-55kD-associated protein, putative, partial [Ixodes scapularis]